MDGRIPNVIFMRLFAVLAGLLGIMAGAYGQVLILGAQAPNDNGLSDNTAVLQELSPPQRPGRRGGVYVTGATAPPSTNTLSRTLSRITNAVSTINSGYSTGGVAAVVEPNGDVINTD